MNPKIITVDGPSGVGKGTIAIMIAEYFNFKYIDSGSLYRSLALALFEKNNDFVKYKADIKADNCCMLSFL